MVDIDALTEFKHGVALLKNGHAQLAMERLRRAVACDRQNPHYLSFLGLSIARAERKWDQASELCEIAVQLEREQVQLYLNLAEVYASAGRRAKALGTLDAALELFGDDERLRRARRGVERRRSSVLPFLRRENMLNRKLGKLLHRILKRLGKDSS
jgi:tetratricopeptide (TPR) repeat protein